jgi:hypothetical protein
LISFYPGEKTIIYKHREYLKNSYKTLINMEPFPEQESSISGQAGTASRLVSIQIKNRRLFGENKKGPIFAVPFKDP